MLLNTYIKYVTIKKMLVSKLDLLSKREEELWNRFNWNKCSVFRFR